MSKYNLLVHTSAVVAFTYTFYFEYYELRDPKIFTQAELNGIRRWKYLTIWNLALQLAFNAASIINDLLPKTAKMRILDTIFASLVLPLGFVVFLAFWPLFLFAPEMLMQAQIKVIFPMWFQHALHSIHMLYIFYEFVYGARIYPKYSQGSKLIFSGALAYVAWISLMEDKWPYPMLDKMNLPWRSLFLGSMVIVCWVIYSISHFIHERGNKSKSKGKQQESVLDGAGDRKIKQKYT